MPQSLAQIYLHLIWSTKNRAPFLQDKNLRDALHGYLAGICNNLDCPSIRVGGVEDHVHILCHFGRNITVANLLRELKRDSSKWVKDNSTLGDFHWQAGYGAFSISPGHAEPLKTYIVNQEEHHREETFQEEFRRLCRKYKAPLDERYAWD